MNIFKEHDRVKMKYYDRYATGIVTIANSATQIRGEISSKVLFDGEFDLAYWYYPNKDLELIDDKT